MVENPRVIINGNSNIRGSTSLRLMRRIRGERVFFHFPTLLSLFTSLLTILLTILDF